MAVLSKQLKTRVLLGLYDLDEADMYAIKSLEKGEANADQQSRAFYAIVKKLCKIGGVSMDESTHETAFNEGKRFVGILMNLIAVQSVKQTFKDVHGATTKKGN